VNLFRKTVALGGDEERTRNSGEGWLALLIARGYLEGERRRWRGDGSVRRAEVGVSHELEEQPKAAFAPFLKFFTTLFDAPLSGCVGCG